MEEEAEDGPFKKAKTKKDEPKVSGEGEALHGSWVGTSEPAVPGLILGILRNSISMLINPVRSIVDAKDLIKAKVNRPIFYLHSTKELRAVACMLSYSRFSSSSHRFDSRCSRVWSSTGLGQFQVALITYIKPIDHRARDLARPRLVQQTKTTMVSCLKWRHSWCLNVCEEVIVGCLSDYDQDG